MKKFFLVMTVFTASIIGAKAQMKTGDFTLGVGVNGALPLGDFKTTSKFGIGGQVQGEYALSENLAGVFTTGYTSFSGKTVTETVSDGLGGTVNESFKYPSVGHIPILVGARYYPVDMFFVGAQIGYAIFTGSGTSNPKGFEYRPQVGVNGGPMQFVLSYDGASVTGGTLSQLGLAVLYRIGK